MSTVKSLVEAFSMSEASSKLSAAYEQLDQAATKAWHQFDGNQEDVAYAVGAKAARLGLTADEAGKWLQKGYTSVFVRMSSLKPAGDAKDIRAWILKAHKKISSTL